MNQPIKTIDPTQLKECLNNNGIIALVFVKRADVLLIGTRSEWVDISVMVEQEVHGSLSGEVQLRRYTSGGDTVLQKGKRYIVAITPVTRFAPRLSLEGFVEVPDGMEADYIDSHRRAVKEISKQ